MRTYEVFLKREGKDPFTHAGSFDAPDEEMALIYARETYGRRSEGEQMWIVPRTAILSANEKELAMADSCLLYTSPSPRDKRQSRMPSSA